MNFKHVNKKIRVFITIGACLVIILFSVIIALFGGKDDIENSAKVSSAPTANENILTVFLTAQELQKIEVFDIAQEQVVKKVENTNEFQKTAKEYLAAINGFYTKVNAFPQEGLIVRLPVSPSMHIQNKWINDVVGEMFVIFPKDEKPYLLILDERRRPIFYTFTGNTDVLLNSLNYRPEKNTIPVPTCSPSVSMGAEKDTSVNGKPVNVEEIIMD